MLILPQGLRVPDQEIVCHAVRAQGAGGQNVNKVATAIHLRFDIRASSLPEEVKQKLLRVSDQRLTSDGVLVIKAQTGRTQEQNRREAVERLRQFLVRHTRVRKKRIATKPSASSVHRRLDSKVHKGRIKQSRGKVSDDA